jgi:type II secretory pathway component PulJ
MSNIPDDRATIELLMARALVAHQRNNQRALMQFQQLIAARFGQRATQQLAEDIQQLSTPAEGPAPTGTPSAP